MKRTVFLVLNLMMMGSFASAGVKTGYWRGVERDMPVTPNGNIAAISCHNCYDSNSFDETMNKIHNAQDDNADLIELDVVQQDGDVRVAHGTVYTDSPYLNDVLADSDLKSGNQILFIEIKQAAVNTDFIEDILNIIMAHGYATDGRPVYIRADHRFLGHLTTAQELLASAAFSSIAAHVRLSVLFFPAEPIDLMARQDAIYHAKQSGYDMVEFNYQQANLFSYIALARSLGLGVNLWTIPASFGEVFVAALREETDALTINSNIEKANQIVADDNSLVYMNAFSQNSAGDFVRYQRADGRPYIFGVNQVSTPEFVLLGDDEDRFGGSLVFNAAKQQYVTFYDGDNSAGNGYLVSAVVNFNDLTLSEKETVSILAKSDSGGFCIEMHNPTSGPPVLRFGVGIGSSYKYATYPIANLNVNDSYMIVGAYDGYGGVYIWINNSLDGTTSSVGYSEVRRNNSPILLGADPQGSSGRRFFFSGNIQMAVVQDWGAH